MRGVVLACRNGLGRHALATLDCTPPSTAKALFPDRFLGLQESIGVWIVRIDANAEEIIAVAGAAIFPRARDANRVLRDSAKPVAQFLRRQVELLRFDKGCRRYSSTVRGFRTSSSEPDGSGMGRTW